MTDQPRHWKVPMFVGQIVTDEMVEAAVQARHGAWIDERDRRDTMAKHGPGARKMLQAAVAICPALQAMTPVEHPGPSPRQPADARANPEEQGGAQHPIGQEG